jgi:hypothetical protein
MQVPAGSSLIVPPIIVIFTTQLKSNSINHAYDEKNNIPADYDFVFTSRFCAN